MVEWLSASGLRSFDTVTSVASVVVESVSFPLAVLVGVATSNPTIAMLPSRNAVAALSCPQACWWSTGAEVDVWRQPVASLRWAQSDRSIAWYSPWPSASVGNTVVSLIGFATFFFGAAIGKLVLGAKSQWRECFARARFPGAPLLIAYGCWSLRTLQVAVAVAANDFSRAGLPSSAYLGDALAWQLTATAVAVMWFLCCIGLGMHVGCRFKGVQERAALPEVRGPTCSGDSSRPRSSNETHSRIDSEEDMDIIPDLPRKQKRVTTPAQQGWSNSADAFPWFDQEGAESTRGAHLGATPHNHYCASMGDVFGAYRSGCRGWGGVEFAISMVLGVAAGLAPLQPFDSRLSSAGATLPTGPPCHVVHFVVSGCLFLYLMATGLCRPHRYLLDSISTIVITVAQIGAATLRGLQQLPDASSRCPAVCTDVAFWLTFAAHALVVAHASIVAFSLLFGGPRNTFGRFRERPTVPSVVISETKKSATARLRRAALLDSSQDGTSTSRGQSPSSSEGEPSVKLPKRRHSRKARSSSSSDDELPNPKAAVKPQNKQRLQRSSRSTIGKAVIEVPTVTREKASGRPTRLRLHPLAAPLWDDLDDDTGYLGDGQSKRSRSLAEPYRTGNRTPQWDSINKAADLIIRAHELPAQPAVRTLAHRPRTNPLAPREEPPPRSVLGIGLQHPFWRRNVMTPYCDPTDPRSTATAVHTMLWADRRREAL